MQERPHSLKAFHHFLDCWGRLHIQQCHHIILTRDDFLQDLPNLDIVTNLHGPQVLVASIDLKMTLDLDSTISSLFSQNGDGRILGTSSNRHQDPYSTSRVHP